jgi:hypothetical protein
MEETTYTYQGGKKLPLSKVTTHFISRATKYDALCDTFEQLDHLSPHSWIVRTTVDRLEEDIERARQLGPAYPAYVVNDTGNHFLVTDRLFVRFRAITTEASAREFGRKYGLDVIDRLTPRDFLFRVVSSNEAIEVVRLLTENEQDVVEICDHDLNIQPQEQDMFLEDPLASLQWYLLSAPPNDHLIAACALVDCQGAWLQCGYGSRDVVISVIDCGCDLTDPNFDADKFEGWAILIDGELQNDQSLGAAKFAIMEPPRFHGTLCATLAAASANRIGGLGAAPGCRLLPVKWQDLGGARSLSQSLFCNIIRYLSDKVDVVSNSWNLGPNGYWPPVVVDCLREAAQNGGRSGNGILWVWSAGNQNCPIDHHSDIPVPTKITSRGGPLSVEESATRFTNSFVGIPGVMHIGAISSLGQRCHYSNYGTGLDLVAPSTNKHLYNRLNVSGTQMMVPLSEHGLHEFGGTSAAAPIVAGVAALVRSANPDLHSTEIAAVLKRTADKKLVMRGYPRSGRRGDLPDEHWDVSPVPPFHRGYFRNRGDAEGTWSPWFGFGKVNAKRAVEEAVRLKKGSA